MMMTPMSTTSTPKVGVAASTSDLDNKQQQHLHQEERNDHSVQERPTFASLLEQANETPFRPNGTVGMHQLHDWSGLEAGGTILELNSNVGRTGGMNFAHRFGCHVTLTNSSPAHLAMAHQFAQKEGLAREQWDTKIIPEMTHIAAALGDQKFDCAIVEEAALSKCSNRDKQVIVQGLAQHAQQVLLHEFCLLQEAEPNAQKIQADLSRALEQEMHVMPVQHWKWLLQEAGLQVSQLETGPVRLLWTPSRLLQEEQGLVQVAHAAWNLATHEELRARTMELHDALESYKDQLGYILIKAVHPDPNRPPEQEQAAKAQKHAWLF